MEEPITMYVPVDKVEPNPLNEKYVARHTPEEYEILRKSIEVNGVRDPIKVRKTEGGYIALGGHTRLKIAKELGIKEIKANIYRNISDEEAEYLLVADNHERRYNDDPIKKKNRAIFLAEYWDIKLGKGGDRRSMDKMSIDRPKKTLADVAEAIGESYKTTQRLLKLNDLTPEWQALVSAGKLGTTVAEQLAYIPPEVQAKMYNEIRDAILEMNLEQIKEVRAKVESGNLEEIDRLKRQLELAVREKKESEARAEKLQEMLAKKEAELRQGHAAMTKLIAEKKQMEEKLAELTASEKARLEALNKEIEAKERELEELKFAISDLKYEKEEIEKRRNRTDEGISTLNKKLKLVLDIKGDVEAALHQIEEDSYGNAFRCLSKYAPVVRNLADLLYAKLDEVARMGSREIPAEVAEKGVAPAASNVVKFKKEPVPAQSTTLA